MDWVKRIRVGWIVSKEESGMHRVKKKKVGLIGQRGEK